MSIPHLITDLAKRIQLLICDVDGVLTSGELYLNNGNDEFKAFNVKDGLGIKLLQRGGINVGIITGRSSDLVKRRAKELSIDPLVQGREDKLTALNQLLENMNIEQYFIKI